MHTVLYGRGIMVGEILFFQEVSWVGEVIWGSDKEALVFSTGSEVSISCVSSFSSFNF